MQPAQPERLARPIAVRVKSAVVGVGLAVLVGGTVACGIPLDTAPRDLPQPDPLRSDLPPSAPLVDARGLGR